MDCLPLGRILIETSKEITIIEKPTRYIAVYPKFLWIVLNICGYTKLAPADPSTLTNEYVPATSSS